MALSGLFVGSSIGNHLHAEVLFRATCWRLRPQQINNTCVEGVRGNAQSFTSTFCISRVAKKEDAFSATHLAFFVLLLKFANNRAAAGKTYGRCERELDFSCGSVP